MKNQAVFDMWLTAATAAARRGLHDDEQQASRDRLWRAEGFSVGECLAALEEAMREERDTE